MDLNCDLAEDLAAIDESVEARIMRHIDSANVCCGQHAGGPAAMSRTVRLAIEHGVRLGAHPGYPDRDHFGRRSMALPPRVLRQTVSDQLSALASIVAQAGGQLAYVKPHGALYHDACHQPDVARVVVEAVARMPDRLAIMGLPSSRLLEACLARGLPYLAEGFADRRYLASGQLAPRTMPEAVIESPAAAVAQYAALAAGDEVPALDGSRVRLRVDSICLHGDHPQLMEILQAVRPTG